MPKAVTGTELDDVQELVRLHPKGVAIAEIAAAMPKVSRRTLLRRLTALVEAGRLQKTGSSRNIVYRDSPQRATQTARVESSTHATFETSEGPVEIPLSPGSREILDYVSQPEALRRIVGYEHEFLLAYEPNHTKYLPEKLVSHLHAIGRPIQAERAAGTFARDILSRLLVDLAWSSSRLEGNTYSRLDTQRLIELGQVAEGKDATETQMVLNHKRAIELLVENDEAIGVNRFTLLNLHSLLSDNLMADPEASGRLRRRVVEIGRSVYVPPGIPQVVEERFNTLLEKGAAIQDPFEQAFFLFVQLPYLQPFEDVNKRVSRLSANIPLIKGNLAPLSFVDVPERAYISGLLGVYELTRIDLMRDVFVWAYERSAKRYTVVRDSLAEPDLFRMKYRDALSEVVRGIVRERKPPAEESEIRRRARPLVDAADLEKFVDLVEGEFGRLYEGNIARHRVTLAEWKAWKVAMGASG